MFELLIGTGGWAYFQVPGLNQLEAYSSVFNFVEVNSTFYEMPNLHRVKSWRRRVPLDFTFSVRCHKDMTHVHQLEPIEEVFNAFDSMKEICTILASRFLVIVTPSVLNFNKRKTESIKNFFESIDLNNITFVWEIRRRRGDPLPNH
ncbi:MAG: DUF72 domain-containing protein [Candidatus Bathyarchaeota archaeon]|nr:MAG: DUF72 domain-containing protein [Candidatus Bathyarchaeota archaeon]